MKDKCLIYESGYWSFDVTQTEKKEVLIHSFQNWFYHSDTSFLILHENRWELQQDMSWTRVFESQKIWIFIFTELSNVLHVVRKRHSKFLCCDHMFDHCKLWTGVTKKNVELELFQRKETLDVLKRLIKTMKLWNNETSSCLQLISTGVKCIVTELKRVESKGEWSCKLKIKRLFLRNECKLLSHQLFKVTWLSRS